MSQKVNPQKRLSIDDKEESIKKRQKTALELIQDYESSVEEEQIDEVNEKKGLWNIASDFLQKVNPCGSQGASSSSDGLGSDESETIIMSSTLIDEGKDDSSSETTQGITCWGCRCSPPQPNQLAHMEPGGCLYGNDEDTEESEDSWNVLT